MKAVTEAMQGGFACLMMSEVMLRFRDCGQRRDR